MANPEHLQILKQGVEAWNDWRDPRRDIIPELSEAPLTDAPLSEAFLAVANLCKAPLSGTNLSESNLIYPLRTDPLIQFYSCFISYNHTDAIFAHRLHDRLQDRGIRCWLDEHQMLPGDDLYTQIDCGIRLWDKVLLCCSTAALTSWWVDHEIDLAFEKEWDLMRTRGEKVPALIPLDLDGFLHQWPSGKAQQARSRGYRALCRSRTESRDAGIRHAPRPGCWASNRRPTPSVLRQDSTHDSSTANRGLHTTAQ
jgi:hypothetical protein